MRQLRTQALVCALCAVCSTACAATTTYTISFATGGNVTASGSYTLTFDPAKPYLADTVSGLTVNSLSFSSGASGFQYDPTVLGGYLLLGGLVNGVGTVNPATDDYALAIQGWNTVPRLNLFGLSRANSTTLLSTQTGTITVTQVATTPEPSSVLLLVTGLAGVGAVYRRKPV